ncbi:hypothetical protein [Variovorax sp. TBS-050B]|uniref:hypothetical protein n=1 Tax=Variovorax sp. TBS-050B TaxID=2940551 RepID=UPI002474CA19|nr:hypothetical protein [Variovorax sp. TBS-050B]
MPPTLPLPLARIRITLLALLLGLAAGAAFAADDAASHSRDPSGNAAFLAAVRDTPLGPDAAQAYFLVSLFRRAGAPADEVAALQRELLHAYVAQLNAPPQAAPAPPPASAWDSLRRRLSDRAQPAPETVATAIARGRTRPAPLDASFREAWQASFDQGLSLRLGPGEGRSPVFLIDGRDLEAIGPGTWAAPSANGQVWLRLSLRLVNNSARPLPVQRPELRLVAENGASLVFQCDWDRAPPLRPPSEMQAHAVTLLAPGAESAPLACGTAPAPGYWRERVPALLLAARTSEAGAGPRLISHDLDSARRLFHLELALTESAPQAADWGQRLQLARREPGSQWTAGERLLEPPERRRWASAPHQGWQSSLAAFKAFMAMTVLALGLFVAGRGLRRAGVPSVVVGVGTLAAGAGAFALAMAQLGGGSGTGYGHPLWTGIALWSVYFGPMLFAVLGLHWLHKLLDAEDLSWWETVATGWRHAANLTRPTSRAEFWGFLAHCTWLWMLARLCAAPLDRWLGAALLLPVLTLAVRRLHSLTRDELAEIGLTVIGVLLLVLLQVVENI